jgi:hypothetical protein
MIRGQAARHRSSNPSPAVATPGRQWRAGANRVSTSSGTVLQSATATSFVRFMWIFITLGLVVVIVVIGFLIGIVRALESIDNGLSTASNSVAGAAGDVQSLPDHIRAINSALSDIDTALKPIPGQLGRHH